MVRQKHSSLSWLAHFLITRHHAVSTSVAFSLAWQQEREVLLEDFEIVDGVVIPLGDYTWDNVGIELGGAQARVFAPTFEYTEGGFYGGDRTEIVAGLEWCPNSRLFMQFDYEYNDIDLPVDNGDFEIALTNLHLAYSFSPKVMLQAMIQYNDRDELLASNIRFSWLQSANAGLYVVYNEIDDELNAPGRPRREFVIKYSRIFDIF